MSFDYLSDIYGKYRVNKENRFSNVETKAVGLIKLFVDSAINNKEFMDSAFLNNTSHTLLRQIQLSLMTTSRTPT